jgi:hypothetical protein
MPQKNPPPAAPAAEPVVATVAAAPPSPAATEPPQGAPSSPAAPPPEPVRLPPEVWAAQKGVPSWQLAAARARHTVDDGRELDDAAARVRAGWLTNGTLTEADFDAALDVTLNGSMR